MTRQKKRSSPTHSHTTIEGKKYDAHKSPKNNKKDDNPCEKNISAQKKKMATKKMISQPKKKKYWKPKQQKKSKKKNNQKNMNWKKVYHPFSIFNKTLTTFFSFQQSNVCFILKSEISEKSPYNVKSIALF